MSKNILGYYISCFCQDSIPTTEILIDVLYLEADLLGLVEMENSKMKLL